MMKLISMIIVSACILYIAPVIACDNGGNDQILVTFQSFANMSARERETLTPLTETELAAIEGNFLYNVCIVCLNIAVVEQVNVLAQTALGIFGDAENSGLLSNYSRIPQDIN